MSEINDIQQFVNNVDPVEIKKMLFKKGNFDFIVSGYDEDGVWCTHEKQRKAFEILTSNKYDEFLYGGAAGGAKGLSVNELVLTPFGFREIGKLKKGSAICATDGSIQRVIARYDNGIIPFYKITFADGTTIDCDYSHIWTGWVNSKRKKHNNNHKFGENAMENWVTEDIYEMFKKNGKTITVPLTEPVTFNVSGSLYGSGNFVKRDLDPYTLGVLIGDGCLVNGVNFYVSDHEIRDRISKLHKVNYKEVKNNHGNCTFGKDDLNEIKNYLTTIKLINKKSHEKFIPKIYLHGSIDERWNLLQGLMDTDGYAAEDGDSYYTTTSKQLADDVTFLARSLGGFVTMRIEEQPHYRDKNGEKVFCKTAYTLRIKCKTPSKLFSVTRKRDRVKNKVHQSYGNKMVSIERIEDKESICISVSNPNSLFITKNFLVTHNSWTGVTWIVFMCLCYPGTRWFIARNELKAILGSVMVTLKKVCEAYGIEHPKFNAVKYFVEFPNGSHIDLIEVKYKPSDPMYEDLGSTEYTGGWIEEVGEINSMAADVISTRVGRHLNKKYGLKGTVFYTCNPKRNWAKTEFYDKHQNGQLYKDNENENNPTRIYLNCLVTENPFIEKEYVKKLRQKASTNKALYERLFKGNWDYEDNPFMLCEQEMIDIIFENDHVEEKKAFLTVDVARFGKDRSILFVWRGFVIIDSLFLQGAKITEVSHAVEYLRNKHGIPKTRCIGDDDGVGGGLVDQTGIKAFKNGSRPMIENGKRPNYKNLQVQCLYKLAEFINKGRIWINCELSNEEKEHIKEELSQIQSVPTRDESKLDCKSKAQIKQDIGRSPDYRDSILMRMYFEFDGHRKRRLGTAKRRRL